MKSLEAVKDYWNARPCNLRHSPEPAGSAAYFAQVEARKYLVEPHIPRFAEFAKWKDKTVLEVGCGMGTDTMRFAAHGAKITAVDLSSESLALARTRARLAGHENVVRFIEANAEALSRYVPPMPVDLIYSFGVLHHTPHPERAFDELPKYCRPGTTLKVMVYNKFSSKAFWILWKYGKGRFWRWEELIARYSEAQEGCPVTFAYSKRQVREILESRGFRVDELNAEHIFPYRIPEYREYRYVKEWYWNWMPHAMFRRFESLLGWHLCATATYIGDRT